MVCMQLASCNLLHQSTCMSVHMQKRFTRVSDQQSVTRYIRTLGYTKQKTGMPPIIHRYIVLLWAYLREKIWSPQLTLEQRYSPKCSSVRRMQISAESAFLRTMSLYLFLVEIQSQTFTSRTRAILLYNCSQQSWQ